MFTKDLERLIRSLVAQRTDPEYIRHYLMETYRLDTKIINQLFTELGVGATKQKFNTKGNPLSGEKKSQPPLRPFS
jgi:hypothetical protein